MTRQDRRGGSCPVAGTGGALALLEHMMESLKQPRLDVDRAVVDGKPVWVLRPHRVDWTWIGSAHVPEGISHDMEAIRTSIGRHCPGASVNLGLDTSVVLRLLVGQPADLALAARRRLEQAHAESYMVVATDLVIAESYYALAHHYRLDKDQARQLPQRMTTSGVVHRDPPEAVEALVAAPVAGLVDRLILHRHRSLQAATLTFDRALGAAGAVPLKSAPEKAP